MIGVSGYGVEITWCYTALSRRRHRFETGWDCHNFSSLSFCCQELNEVCSHFVPGFFTVEGCAPLPGLLFLSYPDLCLTMVKGHTVNGLDQFLIPNSTITLMNIHSSLRMPHNGLLYFRVHPRTPSVTFPSVA